MGHRAADARARKGGEACDFGRGEVARFNGIMWLRMPPSDDYHHVTRLQYHSPSFHSNIDTGIQPMHPVQIIWTSTFPPDRLGATCSCLKISLNTSGPSVPIYQDLNFEALLTKGDASGRANSSHCPSLVSPLMQVNPILSVQALHPAWKHSNPRACLQ